MPVAVGGSVSLGIQGEDPLMRSPIRNICLTQVASLGFSGPYLAEAI
jgi:hypothetical protein